MILSSRHDHNSEQEPPPERPEVNFYLKMPPTDASKGQIPSRLARMMGLDLYSDVLLGKSTRTEMSFAAVILLIVSLFEFIAWFFLFNAIFNSDLVKIDWPTLPAVLMASLFAAAVFWFERQFLTTDEDRRGRAWGAATVRAVFILTSAFITAQPLELLFFRVPVQKRVHEEGIREEAVSKLAVLRKEGEHLTKAIENKSGRRVGIYQDTQKQIEALVGQKGNLETQLTLKEGVLAAAKRDASLYRRERDSADTLEERRRAESAYRRAESAAAAAAREIGQIRLRIGAADSVLDELRGRAHETQVQLDEFEDTLQKNDTGRDRRLRSWIDQLKDSEPREEVQEKWKIEALAGPANSVSSIWDEPWSYMDPEYDFFEQIHVVWDLVNGRPPRWLNAPPEIQRSLEGEYGFASLDQGRRGWQWHLFLSVVACHLIAIFIPFLVLTIKLALMPRALRNYYSRRHQAAAGDADAWRAQIVDESVKGM